MSIHSELGKANLQKLYMDYANGDEWLAQNHNKIEVAAYYKAEARGFEPGHELQDWLEARDEIVILMAPHEFFV